MKLFRTPNIRRRVTDPFKPQRIISHNLGVKSPRGYGFLRNFKKALYNRLYNLITRKLF